IMVAPSPDPMYEIRQIPGNGKGLVARRNINRGERIIAENPLFTFPNINDTMPTRQVIGPKVLALPADQQRTFYGLYNNFIYFGTTASIGIIKTNALPVDNDTDAVFPTFSLSNHSCLPKASYSWNGDIMQGTLHATRNISAGNEITIAYGDHRRGLPQQAIGFRCTCALCSSSPGRIAKSDARRVQIQRLQRELADSPSDWRNPGEELVNFHKMLEVVIDEYSGTYHQAMAWIYDRAFSIAAFHGDHDRAGCFAERAYRSSVICHGADSLASRRLWCFMRNPERDSHFGTRNSWGMSSATYFGVPRGLEPIIFEAWLWRLGLQGDSPSLTRADVGHV
ncbi:hypothetical protein BKA64DRAFT_582603, partial [Cadophora sp. MPI-SDFR-AT-0126]